MEEEPPRSNTYPSYTPANLIALGSEIIVAQLLNIKVVDLERCVCHIGLLAWLRWFEEEGVVIGILQASINMEEAGNRIIISVDEVGRGQGQSCRVPVVHVLIHTLGVSHPVMTPAMHRRWARLKPLKTALARLVVLVINGKSLQIHGLLLLLLPSPDEMDWIAEWIG